MHKKICYLSVVSSLFLSYPSYSLPKIEPNSVIFDDKIELAFEKWFNTIFNAAPSLKRTLKPRVYLVANSVVNAGAGPGGQFVVFSGLFKSCERIEEFLGVIAHEAAHTKGNHMVLGAQASRNNMLVAAIAFALGGVAALAGGDVAPLIAGLAGGQGMYAGAVLKHTRDLENAADADAIEILKRAKLPASGLLTFLQKLEKEHGAPDVNPYFLTHPLNSDRINALKPKVSLDDVNNWAEREAWQALYAHVRAKILGFTLRPQEVFNIFKGQAPHDYLARAIAYGRQNQTAKALSELEHVLATAPNDASLLEIKAQLLLDKQDINGAIQCLEQAALKQPRTIYLKMSLAHLLTEQGKDTDKALKILKEVTQRSDHTDFAWYLMGKVYAQMSKPGHALWANAEYDARTGDIKAAEKKLERARAYIKTEPDLALKIGDTKVDIREQKGDEEA